MRRTMEAITELQKSGMTEEECKTIYEAKSIICHNYLGKVEFYMGETEKECEFNEEDWMYEGYFKHTWLNKWFHKYLPEFPNLKYLHYYERERPETHDFLRIPKSLEILWVAHSGGLDFEYLKKQNPEVKLYVDWETVENEYPDADNDLQFEIDIDTGKVKGEDFAIMCDVLHIILMYQF